MNEAKSKETQQKMKERETKKDGGRDTGKEEEEEGVKEGRNKGRKEKGREREDRRRKEESGRERGKDTINFLDSLSLSSHLSASGCQDPSLVTHIASQDFDIPSQELHAASPLPGKVRRTPLPGKVRRTFSLLPSLSLILSGSPFSSCVVCLLPVANHPRHSGSEQQGIVSHSLVTRRGRMGWLPLEGVHAIAARWSLVGVG